jgi:hypothetical protein
MAQWSCVAGFGPNTRPPDGDQVDLVEVMELNGARISHHRIYWGWFGAPLLQR